MASNPMLAVCEKKSNRVELYKPLRQFVVQHYSEREALHHEDDLRQIQEMRAHVIEKAASGSLEARRDLLQRYYRALCIMESRFPISNERDHMNTISFTWYDAFKPSKKASQQSIHFEKTSVIFNLGAVQSQLGLAADRTAAAGIKQACNAFQAAAGAFAFLRDSTSAKAWIANASTVDVSVECASMLERLMLAQAQECFFEKVVADEKPSSLCSKIARQVSLYYEEVHASLMLHPLNQHFERPWITHVQLKAAQYFGEASYRIALDLHENEDIAEEIARLKLASSSLASAKKSAKGAVAQLIESVSKLEGDISLNLNRALKENDRVYLMKIPAPNSLGSLSTASLVKPTNLAEVLDSSKENIFTGLIPDSCARAVSRYTDLLDKIVRTQVERMQRESEITRVKLNEMDLPESLHALEGTVGVPEELQKEVESIQLDGGLAGLEAAMTQLQDLRHVNEELLVQAEEELQKECQEDGQFRGQFGSRWSRPPSIALTKSFSDRLSSCALKLKQAADMDTKIDRLIRDHWAMMSLLDIKPIEASLPALMKPIMSVNGDEDTIVGTLKQSLGELELLASQRAGIEDTLKDRKQKDNILPKVLSTSGSYEELFKEELAKYDPLCQEVSKNVEAQERLLRQITEQNNTFTAIFNLEDFNASRDRILKQIGAAVSKYREIWDLIHNSGIKFYISLLDAIKALKQQCAEYAMARTTESRDMIESLQRQLAGFSFEEGRASMKYPPVSQHGRYPSYYASEFSSTQASYSSPNHFSNHLQAPAPPHYPPPGHQASPQCAAPERSTERPSNLEVPPPPYYPPQGQNQHAPPFTYSQASLPQPVPPYHNNQLLSTGWQDPYYYAAPMNAHLGRPSQAYSSYHSRPPAAHYSPSQRGYYR